MLKSGNKAETPVFGAMISMSVSALRVCLRIFRAALQVPLGVPLIDNYLGAMVIPISWVKKVKNAGLGFHTWLAVKQSFRPCGTPSRTEMSLLYSTWDA